MGAIDILCNLFTPAGIAANYLENEEEASRFAQVGRTKNVVGKKSTGKGRYCLMKKTPAGKSSSRCYGTQAAMETALQKMYDSPKTYRSIMLYQRKRPR